MTCRKVRRLIPLAAGEDLRPRQAAAVRAHIAACPDCRAEIESFREDLAGIKAAAKTASVAEWTEGEWNAALAHAVTSAPEAEGLRGRSAGSGFRPRWAAASVAGAFLGLVLLGLILRGPSPRPETAAGSVGALIAAGTGEQDRLTMTLVSPETGLQIVWTFDKNFDWKGDRP
jgi:anti-sigma factor RsiW